MRLDRKLVFVYEAKVSPSDDRDMALASVAAIALAGTNRASVKILTPSANNAGKRKQDEAERLQSRKDITPTSERGKELASAAKDAIATSLCKRESG